MFKKLLLYLKNEIDTEWRIFMFIGFIISGLLSLHPSIISEIEELGLFGWWILICGFFVGGLIISSGIFVYYTLGIIAIQNLLRDLRNKDLLGIILTLWQIVLFLAMTSIFPIFIITSILKLYFNYSVDLFEMLMLNY